MIEPIQLAFEVDCPVDHAFEVWTARIAQWWPLDHTVSAEEGLTVVLEGRPGGRIFERRVGGQEHDWGEVTIWEPPTRFGYTWHLKRDRSDATDVEIRIPPSPRRRDPGRDRASRVGAAGRRRRRLAGPQLRRLVHAPAALPRGHIRLTPAQSRSSMAPVAGSGKRARRLPRGRTDPRYW